MTHRRDSLGVRAGGRVAGVRTRVAAVRGDIARWVREHAIDPRFARFSWHFTTLNTVYTRLLDAIDGDIAKIDVTTETAGVVYERCRATDFRIGVVRRLHEWYAAKYDQRADDPLSLTLRAADEVVRSCWTEPFAVLGRTPPTGPLVYLDPRFDAVATPRESVPPDLRAPGDTIIGDWVKVLPIPVVALPAACVDEPWWLVLAAHETGHHVQLDLGLLPSTREALLAATGDTLWLSWAQETFADAFAALMVGPAAAWAVDELQFGTPASLVTVPTTSDRYPPPAVRTALLGELARHIGIDQPGADHTMDWLHDLPDDAVTPQAREAVAAQLALTERAAKALIDLPVGDTTLRGLCSWQPEAFAENGKVSQWARRLAAAKPTVTGRAAHSAARHAIAGAVATYLDPDSNLDLLRRNVPDVISQCGPPGVLAATPSADVSTIADRLADQLMAARPDERSA